MAYLGGLRQKGRRQTARPCRLKFEVFVGLEAEADDLGRRRQSCPGYWNNQEYARAVHLAELITPTELIDCWRRCAWPSGSLTPHHAPRSGWS